MKFLLIFNKSYSYFIIKAYNQIKIIFCLLKQILIIIITNFIKYNLNLKLSNIIYD